jgi:PAT family beta-lactamase induction signal transducer AmpG
LFGKLNMTISTLTGTAIGGWLYLRWGLFRSMLTFGVLQAATNLLYMALALSGKVLWLMALATSVDNLAGGMGGAAFIAFVMAQCNMNFSAFQYAILSALASLPSRVVGPIAATVVASFGWANFFVITFLAATPGLALLLYLRADVKELEGRDRARLAA